MSKCQVCGEPVPDGDARCPQGHYQLATCALCGTERDRDVAACPACGSTWLDYPYREPEVAFQEASVNPPKPPRPSEEELTAATMRQPWRPPGEELLETELIDLRESAFRNRTNWWQVGRYVAMAVVGVGLVAVVSYVFGELGGQTGSPIPTVAAITSTREAVTTTPATSAQVSVAATSATAPATTVPTTTTTLLVTPVGDAIPVNDLRLTIYGIGDLKIGDPEDQVAGALAATFGQPDFEQPVEPNLAHPGACPGSASRAMRWGILEITLNDGSFAGYRIDLNLGDADSPTAQLRTASGLRVGATLSTLETIYQTYGVVYGEKAGFGPVFSLRRTNGEELLWGPISSAERSGVVLGIYSPSDCG